MLQLLTYTMINTFFFSDECWIGLTSNTIYFSKAYLNFVDDALKLHTDEIHSMVEKSLYDIIRAQMKHVEICAKNEKFKNEVSTHLVDMSIHIT